MKIASDKEREFILNNLNSDTNKLLLQSNEEDIDVKFCVKQIIGYNKAKEKFPSLLEKNNLLFPPKINLEQTSSEQTAKYKASLFPKESTLRDLTSGFGIDVIFFAKELKKVYYHEINYELACVAEENFKVLELDNIIVNKGNSANDIDSLEETDIIYLDPSRRDENNNKVFLLKDCQPDIIEILPFLFDKAKTICIKLSPMLDIKLAIKEINYIKEIHVISVKNECKELLLVLEKVYEKEIKYTCIDFDTNGKINKFSFTTEKSITRLADQKELRMGAYIYEPNTSILKAGGFHSLCERFEVKKIASHSHLYISEKEIEDFPGRKFIIKTILPYNNKILKTLSTRYPKANITIRNFPQTVSEIRKKTNVKEGGETYLLFTTNKENEKIIISCEKS
ncbi:MAG: SAM-dependent methyltransferase [Bacteroidetes bacterium]|nr:SAM-dependent methyltransferase [Bacteroidota bacterium]